MKEKPLCEAYLPKAKLVLHHIRKAVAIVSSGYSTEKCRKEYLLNTHFFGEALKYMIFWFMSFELYVSHCYHISVDG